MRVRNTFIIFVVSGFWHGANWTFIIWGALNAIFIMPSILLQTNRNNLGTIAQGKLLPSARELFQMGLTFTLTVFAWIFFRADNLGHAFQYIRDIFSHPGSFISPGIYLQYSMVLILILLFMIIEWVGREEQYALAKIGLSWNKTLRWIFYISIGLTILMFSGKTEEFIYFQF